MFDKTSLSVHGPKSMNAIRTIAALLALLFGLAESGQVVAQGGGNGNTGGSTGGFNTGIPTTTQFPTTTQSPSTQQTTGNNTGGTDTTAQQPNIGDDAMLDIGGEQFEFEEITNAFVGSTGATIAEDGFVGSIQESMTGQTAGTGGGSTGGNTGLRNAGNTGRGLNSGLGGFGGSQYVQQIPRGGVRARLVNRVGGVRPTGQFVRERVESRFLQTPALQSSSLAGVSISVDNGTATLTGVASSQEIADRLVRQLRLEPGVYKVDNRLSVASQQ